MLRILLLVAVICGALRAQDPELPDLKAVEKQITTVEAGALPKPVKDNVLAALRDVQASLTAAAEAAGKAKEFADRRETAGVTLAGVQRDLRAWQRESEAIDVADGIPAAEEQERTNKAARDQARTDVSDAKSALALRRKRQREVPAELAAARKKLDEFAAPAVPADTVPDLVQALRWQGTAQKNLLAARVAVLEAEQATRNDGALGELLQARLELAERQLVVLDARLSAVAAELDRRRRAAAVAQERRASRTADAASGGHPLLELVSRQNAELAKENLTLTAAVPSAERRAKEMLERRERLTEDLKNLRRQVERYGLNESVGVLLRQQRMAAQAALREAAVGEAAAQDLGRGHVRLAELDQRVAALAKPDLGERMDALDLFDPSAWPEGKVPPEAGAWTGVAPELERLLKEQADTVEALHKNLGLRGIALAQVVAEAEQLRVVAVETRDFVNENVLWVPTPRLVWAPTFSPAAGGLAWLCSFEGWTAAARTLRDDAARYQVGYALCLLLALLLLVVAFWGRRRVQALGAAAAQGATATFRVTVLTLLLTAVIALPVPFVVGLLGWRLGHVAGADTFATAAAPGLIAVAWLLLAGGYTRCVAASRGLAEAHFRWPAPVLVILRRDVTCAILLAAPLTFALVALEVQENDPWRQAAGRTVMLVLLLVLAVAMWRMLHPDRGLLATIKTGRVARWRRFWYRLGIGMPVVLATLACLGYQFTVVQLVLRLLATLGFAFGLVIAYGMVLRSLALARRDLALRQAKEKAAAAAAAASESGAPVDPAIKEAIAAPQIDLGLVGQQMRSLLHGLLGIVLVVGAYFLWIDVLPALAILSDVVFWTDVVDGQTSKVTLASFLLAAVYVLVTLLAARNLTGLLELVVLQRFDLQAGERHAVTTIVRYTVLAIGFALAFSAVGIGWGKVQWLVAALGVGLGFGLQEIFANFVSGVIILFEQPIRVGDLVTVSNINGYVTRIRIRSTVITDLDRRELIVPNKEFITGQVVNWSLSDPITRIVIRVGVAYGTDTREARRLLLDCARRCRYVLDEPTPKALFIGFGESSLDLELRVFIKSMDDYPALMNDLNTRIDEEFKRAGLEIPFPQRDIHVRSVPRSRRESAG